MLIFKNKKTYRKRDKIRVTIKKLHQDNEEMLRTTQCKLLKPVHHSVNVAITTEEEFQGSERAKWQKSRKIADGLEMNVQIREAEGELGKKLAVEWDHSTSGFLLSV